jgi:hypothetical protein
VGFGPLIPVESNGKRPLVRWREYQHRFPTEAEVTAWRREHASANWAVVTGAISGLVVLDCDPRRGGDEALRGRTVPITYIVRTQGGGSHYYFAHPGGVIPCVPDLLPGVDLKGEGGYVLVPPSRIDGRPYTVEIDAPLAALPEWVVELLRRRTVENGQNALSGAEVVRLLRGVHEGQRDTTATRLAGRYLAKGLGRGEVLELLRAWNARNSPPLTDADIVKCVRSISASELRKLAAHEAAAEPVIEHQAGGLVLSWPALDVRIALTLLRERSDGVHGELLVTHAGKDVTWQRVPLASGAARDGLAKKLRGILPAMDWQCLIERAARAATQYVREGAPTVRLTPTEAPGLPHLLVDPLLGAHETAVLFGDGGSGKGWVALTIAIAAATDTPLPGLRPMRRVPVLYLDWEADEATLRERLALLRAGLNLADVGTILYRPMARALADELERVRRDVLARQVGLVVVDSFGPACGTEPETADAATRLFNALRELPAARLVVAHVSKAAAEQRGASRPYGSVYVWNLARSVWELRRAEDEDDDLLVGLFHRKTNRGRLYPPFGLRFTFGERAVALARADIEDQPDLLARTSLTRQLLALLRSGAKTVDEIVDALPGTTPDSARRTLNRLRERNRVVRLPGTSGRAGLWGLPA